MPTLIRALLACGAAFLLVLLAAPPAHADIISEEEEVCRDKKAGDACTISGEAGACITAKCGRNDYSDGPPPKTVYEDCLQCEVGKEPAAGDDDEKTSGRCSTATRLSEPLPLSLASLFVGSAFLLVLYRRRRSSTD